MTSGQTASTTTPPRARAASTTSGAEPWALSIRGAPVGHLGHVVDEDDALVAEAVDHVPVVDDLVVAVDRRLEDPHHPGQGLDGLLDAGAEPPGLGQHHSLDSGHKVQVIGSNLVAMSAPTVTSVTAASPAARAGLAVGDELLEPERARAARRHRFPTAQRRGRPQRPGPARRRARCRASSGSTRQPASRWVSRCPPPSSTASGPATTTARSASSTSSPRACGAACTSRTTTTGCRSCTATSPPSPASPSSTPSASSPSGSARCSSPSTARTPSCGRACCATRRGRPACAGSRCCSTAASRCTARSSSARASTTVAALEDTLAGILDRYPALASVGAVPLGV